jgi:signal transduction histidine kinase
MELLTAISQYLALALHREITGEQLREAQARLSDHAHLLEAQVADRTARLTDTVSELETFSYSLAHDLRAPIRSLKGYCDVLVEDYAPLLPPSPKAIVAKVARSCDRLDQFTRDLLEFTRISRQEINLTTVEPERELLEALSLGSPELREVTSVRSPLQPVKAHAGLLQRCFVNLLENALKFRKRDEQAHITVWTETTHTCGNSSGVRPSPFSSALLPSNGGQTRHERSAEPTAPGRVRIWVEDAGIGIPKEAHAKIFGIFERWDVTNNRPGTGIGLAIVARAVQRMGGTCGVESELGVGSRFWMELEAGEVT